MYILYKVVKHKTNIRGYWLDNKDKLYKDNITLKRYTTRKSLDKGISGLFKTGQEAVFYKEGQRAFIVNKTGKVDILSHRSIVKVKRLSSQRVKGLLARFKGLTVFKGQGGYTIEIWKA